jgi:hypothetical protein
MKHILFLNRLLANFAWLVIISASPAYCEPEYEVVPIIPNSSLDLLPGLNLNNNGDVPVARRYFVDGVERFSAGYVDASGNFHNISAFDGNIDSYGVFINNQRQIIGYQVPNGSPSNVWRVFRYTPWLNIETFELPSFGLHGMNNKGGFVGRIMTVIGTTGYIKSYCKGCPSVSELDGYSFGSINDSWRIAATDIYGDNLFIIGQDGGIQNISQHFQPFLRWAPLFKVTKISNHNSVLISANEELVSMYQAKFWDGVSATATRIVNPNPGMCSEAASPIDMSNNDVVVGYSTAFNGFGCTTSAFVWDRFKGFRDINTLIDYASDRHLWDVVAINDRADILIRDIYSNYLLLRPAVHHLVPKPAPLPVPIEPIIGGIVGEPVEPIEDPINLGPATE